MAQEIESKGIYVATESYWWADPAIPNDLGGVHIRKGITRYRGADPAVQANPQWWEPVGDNLTRDVEQATAEPGEKRGTPAPAEIAEIKSKASAETKSKATA